MLVLYETFPTQMEGYLFSIYMGETSVMLVVHHATYSLLSPLPCSANPDKMVLSPGSPLLFSLSVV